MAASTDPQPTRWPACHRWVEGLRRRSAVVLQLAILAAMILVVGVQPVQALADRLLENPPLLEPRDRPTPRAAGVGAPAMAAEQNYDLKIIYTDGTIYNPATQRDDKLRLRSYVGTGTKPETPYISPTIETTPGSTVRVTLHNKLPDDPSCIKGPDNEDQPHCFNGTNLHTHGLWVSPSGNSDNVLLSVNPGVDFEYEYNIPPDHPSGTFWYHTHRHGSTALQVSSGMAGALIVRGDRLPSTEKHGDLDTLLKHQDGTALPEQILVLQQIHYACLDKAKQIKKKVVDGKVVAWVCDPDDRGGIESYANFGPETWTQSGHYTSINGQVLPTMQAKAGDIQRWRLIHAGVENTISLEFRKRKDDAPTINDLAAADADSYIKTHCQGDPLPYHVIADDGITRSAAWQTTLTTLQPGYRSDALVVFPEAGSYCVVDASAPASASPSQQDESRQLLGIVTVEAGTPVTDIPSYLTRQLIAAAEQTMPRSVQAAVIADLQEGLKFSLFTPHADISNNEVLGHQELAFFIDTATPRASYEISNKLAPPKNLQPYDFDSHPYDSNRIDRHLTLNSADEWTLTSYYASHPYHIHVNPFQIVKILDPKGRDLSLPNAEADDGDPQYRGLSGVWKDTLWIKSSIPNTKQYPEGIYTFVVRSRYERYLGEFVIHCHILDHEDRGMMQNVSIVLGDGKGDPLSITNALFYRSRG